MLTTRHQRTRERWSLPERYLRELKGLRRGVHLRVDFVQHACRVLPDYTLARTRAALLRAAGLQVGRGSAIQGQLYFVGSPKNISGIIIGTSCIVGPDVSFGLDAPIRIADNVALGPGVVLCTATHMLGFGSRRMNLGTDARPINIGAGAWICLRAVILPGVTVGAGAVVSAGAYVTEDVPPHTLVAGNPAVVVRELPFPGR
jgi:acetyltransferase-like isoleucine patch superfamily enzyme